MSHYTDQPAPERALPRDEFTTRRRDLTNHPEGVTASTRLDVTDDYGSVTTWVLDLIRVESRVTAFLQRGARDGYIRLVLPPQVTAAIARHQDALVTKARRQTARRVVADRRARGESLGNPDALRKARKVRSAKRS